MKRALISLLDVLFEKETLAIILVGLLFWGFVVLWVSAVSSSPESEVNPTACFTGNCVYNNDTGEWGPYEGGHTR